MKALLAAALLIPGLVFANTDCNIQKPEALTLDLEGVTTVVVEMGADTLHVVGAADADGVLQGRACASSDKRMALLSLKQERHGDRLTLTLERAHRAITISFGSDYAYHDVSVKIPPTLAIELHMGSGDAAIDNVAALSADLGSGDLEARQIAGTLRIAVGSGDVVANTVGALQLDSVGSGDVSVDGVAADTRIGSVGSGDVSVRDGRGAVAIDTLGSGDITLHGVNGNVELERMGSGDLYVTDIDGDVTVHHSGSGDVHSKNVKGEVSKPRS